MTDHNKSTGYGPRVLIFSGEEEDYDLWEVRFLGYMALQNLKKTILPGAETPDDTKNERAYAELVMILDAKSLSMVMTDAADDGRKALSILRDHYRGASSHAYLHYTQTYVTSSWCLQKTLQNIFLGLNAW